MPVFHPPPAEGGSAAPRVPLTDAAEAFVEEL
jgi:hypothetical protein